MGVDGGSIDNPLLAPPYSPPYPPLAGDSEAELAAGEAVRNYCGWHIAPAVTEVMVVDGSGSSVQALPTLYINAVGGVTDADQVLGDDDYEWSQAGFLRRRCWSRRLRGVTVTLTHGYDVCPAEVRAVVLGLARSGLVAPGLKSQTVGPFSATMSDQSLAGVIGIGVYESAILDRYRLPALS